MITGVPDRGNHTYGRFVRVCLDGGFGGGFAPETGHRTRAEAAASALGAFRTREHP